MNDDRPLNADAIYAAMVWLRDYAESPEGQAAVNAVFDEKAEKVDSLRALGKRLEASSVDLRPVFEVTDTLKDEIYPGEPDSVEMGIEFARFMIWGTPNIAEIMLNRGDPKDPISRAISRFVADRAN